MMRTRLRAVLATTALVAGLGVTGATGTAAAADPTVVVGLGDSFASGEGVFVYNWETAQDDVNECHRSPLSWQQIVQIPAATDVQRKQVACSGAVVADVLDRGKWNEPAQITELQGRTDEDVVLLSIGGNDVGFRQILEACLGGACLDVPGFRERTAANIVAATREVRRALEAVVVAAPQATVVLAGYPQVLQGGCATISAAEAGQIDQWALDVRRAWVGEVMQMRVQGKRVRFADTIDPFAGHGACHPTGPAWINTLFSLPPEAFHPNEAGQQAYAAAVTEVLRADPMRCDGVGCRIRFRNESVYGSVGGGVRSVRLAIRTGYEAAGEERGTLGYPVSDEYDVGTSGRGQRFAGGEFLVKAASGTAYWVGGKFLTKYQATGGAGGELGYPTGNAYANTGGTGQTQVFERGRMFLKTGGTQAFWSKGAILGKYAATGYERGPLGYPKTDHACGLQPDNACRQHFDGSGDSIIYWSSFTGTHAVTGNIRDFYASTGYQNSRPDITTVSMAGYPTSDRYRPAGSTVELQNFENGIIAVVDGRPCWGIPDSDVCFPPAPAPRSVSNAKVGTIVGVYARSPQRDYGGYAYPAAAGQCVAVERKTAAGTWTGSSVTTSPVDRCAFYSWGIATDTAVSDTTAIRLRVYSGPNSPTSYVGLCNTKTECLAM